MRKRKNESVEFEDYIWTALRRRFPAKLGWEREQERPLRTGGRADYTLHRQKYGKNERAVVEAKNVKELTISHVDQVDQYARTYHATHRIIAVPKGTKVSEEAKNYLDDLKIDLLRTRFRKRAK